LDGDGRKDIISGCWFKRIYLFRQRSDGAFNPGEPIAHRDGQPIVVDYGTAAFAADWDADNDLDLLAGTAAGNVYLVPNQGSATQWDFDKPIAFQANGEQISVPDGYAGPAVADWDGDGRLDLLLGAGDGSVLWYRNVGTRAQSKLDAAQNLVPPPRDGSDRGLAAKICVTDWNEDGQLDLLVGDCGSKFEKTLSAEEQAWREKAQVGQTALLRDWSQVFHDYRDLLRKPEPKTSDQRADRDSRLRSLRGEMMRLKALRNSFFRKEQALMPGEQRHGRVWLFLRDMTQRER